jgi:DNA-binding beta-propeller fold protein YncE
MAIQADQPVDPADFIDNSERNVTPALDEGRVPKLENTGKLHRNFLPSIIPYDPLTTYVTDDIVTYEGSLWISQQANNLGNTPAINFPTDLTFAQGNNGLTTGGEGVFITPDGTKIFLVDGGSVIEEYTLSTAFDMTTAGSRVSHSVGGGWDDITFNPDGTKVYRLNGANELDQYSLSTAYDISTISASEATVAVGSISGENIRAFAFSKDGQQLVITASDRRFITYVCGAPFDITNGGLGNEGQLPQSWFDSTGADNLESITFDVTGRLAFIADNVSDIHCIYCVNPYDLNLSTQLFHFQSSFDGTFSIGSNALEVGTDGNIYSTRFSNNGARFEPDVSIQPPWRKLI